MAKMSSIALSHETKKRLRMQHQQYGESAEDAIKRLMAAYEKNNV